MWVLLSLPHRPDNTGMLEQEGDSKIHSTPTKTLPGEVKTVSNTMLEISGGNTHAQVSSQA